jgi:hypothetical protein
LKEDEDRYRNEMQAIVLPIQNIPDDIIQ